MRSFHLTSLCAGVLLLFSACGTPPAQPSAAPAEVKPAATTVPKVFSVGEVAALESTGDNAFNAMAYAGVEKAISELGIQGKYLQSQQQEDYAKNIQILLDENTNLIITAGYLLGVDTAMAARANPNVKFAIVDYAYPDCQPGDEAGRDCGSNEALQNVEGLTFKADEAAFMAGYLAAGMSRTGRVATYGGIDEPTVTSVMKGFEAGVRYYNAVKGTGVQVLGWDPTTRTGMFVGNFESLQDGRTTAKSLVENGADIIMPVARHVGLGSAAYCQESGSCWIIGVETDMAVSAPEYEDVILSSVIKNVNVAVFDTIQAAVEGTFQGGGVYAGTLANEGVSLAPYHNFESQIPVELKAEIEQLKDDIISGAVAVNE